MKIEATCAGCGAELNVVTNTKDEASARDIIAAAYAAHKCPTRFISADVPPAIAIRL